MTAFASTLQTCSMVDAENAGTLVDDCAMSGIVSLISVLALHSSGRQERCHQLRMWMILLVQRSVASRSSARRRSVAVGRV